MVLDSFFDLFAGADDKDKNALLQNHTGCAAVLPWMSLEGHAGTAWRELVRQLGVQKQTLIASTPGALLPQSSRSRKRVLMEAGRDEDGRTDKMRRGPEETWKSAEMSRNKYVIVSHANIC